jgi:hypothetical protein
MGLVRKVLDMGVLLAEVRAYVLNADGLTVQLSI